MTLLHAAGVAGPKEVYSLDLSKKTWEASGLARVMRGKAESFAEALGGVQTFHLVVYYGKSEEGAAVHPFNVIEGEVAPGDGSHVREQANAAGLTGMLMRHVEKKDQSLMQVFQGIVVQMMQDRHLLQKEVNDAYQIVREQMMKSLEMDHALRMKELEFQRGTKEREAMLKLAPALINTVAGAEILPQATVDSAIVEALARNVKPEHLELLKNMGIVKPEVLTPLIARFQEITERDRAEAEAIKRVTPSANELDNAPSVALTTHTNGRA
jgi:hypothetical protein